MGMLHATTRALRVAGTRKHVSLRCHAPLHAGASSTPRPLGSSTSTSGLLDRPVKPGADDGKNGDLKTEPQRTCASEPAVQPACPAGNPPGANSPAAPRPASR